MGHQGQVGNTGRQVSSVSMNPQKDLARSGCCPLTGACVGRPVIIGLRQLPHSPPSYPISSPVTPSYPAVGRIGQWEGEISWHGVHAHRSTKTHTHTGSAEAESCVGRTKRDMPARSRAWILVHRHTLPIIINNFTTRLWFPGPGPGPGSH